jgi:Ca2+-binding RTX toxin-like protein
VNAGSDDTVSGSGWTYGGTIVSGDVIYHSWTQSGATLHVQDGAIQNFTDNGRTVATFNGGTYDGSSSSSSLLVVGSSSADSITTGSGNDLLQGLVGNDTLAGGAGTDILQGGDGDDTLVYSSGADTYTGGSGTDTLLVQSGTTLDLSESWQSGSSGLESITLGSGANTLAIGSLTSWSSIFGTTLTVNAGSDDTVSGSGWAYGGTIVSGDVIYHSWTQSGATLHVQDGAIQNFTDNGRTVAMFNGGTYDGSSSSSSLLVVGRSSDDTITTGSGNDLVYGGAGNDTIKTNGGNDIVFGGAGADVIIGGSGLGNDTYYGGSSESVDDSDADWITYSSATNAIIVNLSTGTATGTDIATDTLYGIENVLGGDGADTITGNSKANILQGGTGDDTLDGGAGNDTLEGGDGNDTLVYSSGADTYTGGSGTDTLLVQSGTTLDLSESWQSGSSGLESITLGSGANTLAIGSLTSWSSIFGTTLTVNAGSDDTVSGSGWTYGGTIVSGEVTYNSWSQNGYTLNIEYGAVLDGLTTLTWDGGASSTTFTDAANWNPDRVPGTGDVIRISGDSTVDLSSGAVQAISITGTSTLNVADGLVLTNGGSIEEGSRIKLASGGTLDTDGTLTFDGRLYLEDAGTLSGDGVININRSGILLPSGGSLDIDGLTLNFNNDLTLGGSLVQRNYSTVVNASGNTLTIDDAGSISGTGTFQILGTVNVKIDSEESFTFGGSNTVLYSSGVIKATTGNVSLGSGSYLGSIEAALGTTVTLTGSQAYYSGAGWSGAGAFVLSSGSIALKADLSTTVGLEFSGSNHITGTESESGTKYGTLTVDSFSQSSVGTVDFDAALLKLSNGGSLSGSTLMGDGTLQLDGGTFIVSGDTAGTTVLTLDTVVTNGATLAVRAISQATTLDLDENGETGSLTIESGGTLSLDQYASGEPTFGVTIDGGTGTIINNGLVWVSDSQGGSTGVVNINGAFVLGSTGTLDVDSTLYLSPGVGKVADLSNGTVDIASGKTVYVSSGTLATGSGTTYGGSGTRTLQFLDGTTWRMGADYTISASTFQIGLAGAVSVVAAAGVSATLTNAGTTAFFSDDTIGVDVVNTGDLGFHAHDAAAGIDGGSTLSGDLTNSGTITVYNGATHEDQAAGNAMTTTVGGTIDNSGLFLFSNGSDTGNLKFDLDTHAFNNSGGVTFANAANTTYEIESTFNNSGTVDLQHDATFSGGSFNNLSGGTIWLENSSTLTWDPTSTGSEFSNDSGGLIQGTGTITLYDSETSSDLTLFNSGTLSPGIGTGSADSSHGSLTINGNLMAKATSLVILDFDLYGEFGHDSLIVSNTFTMAGTLDIHVFGTASGATSYTGYLTAGTLAGQFDEITGMNSTAGATVGSYALHPSLNGTTELTFKSLSVTAVGSSFNNDNRWGDVVIGTSGNDTFLVSGTHSSEDFFYGGDGNDTVTLASLDPNSDSFSTDPQSYSNLYFDFLDGGAGTDTLRIENTTNLTSVSWEKVQGFEIIDFNAEGGTLTIDDTIVKALASGTNGYLDSALSTYNTAHGTSFSAQDALVIDLADSSTLDKVGADMGAWEDKGTIQLDLDGNETNESYTVYTHGDATIYVHDGSDSSPVVAG